jgi:predicted phosphodiesterase
MGMARFRVFSDIHSEFHRDWGRSFVDSLPVVPCDAIILAGDMGDSRTVLPFLKTMCAKFRDVPILFVAGNHDHYGSDIVSLRELLTEAVKGESFRNLVHLDNTVIEVSNVRVAGTTLWFPFDPMNVTYRNMMHDFRVVRDLDTTAYEENRQARRFLETARADLIVTHHLPCPAVTAPRWRNSEINRFFVGGDDDLVSATGAKAWVFGHTHDATDLTHLGVRLIANPFGYPSESKSQFRDDFVVTV